MRYEVRTALRPGPHGARGAGDGVSGRGSAMWQPAERLRPHPRSRSVSSFHDGGALHFYERVGIPEARHPDGRHGWVLPSAQAPPHVAYLAAVRPVVLQIHRVDGQGDQVTGVTARGPEGGEQVT